jgi:hypothetical protein
VGNINKTLYLFTFNWNLNNLWYSLRLYMVVSYYGIDHHQ